MILVTGGAGFIGSNLVHQLVQKGEEVRVLDNLSAGRRENLEGLKVDLRVGDIRDPEQVRDAIDGTDFVVHLAAAISVEESMRDPLLYFEVNQSGSINVLEACRLSGVSRVILASSAAVYGAAEGVVSEEQEPRPLSPYAQSKLGMEAEASFYSRIFNLETVILRFFNVYGPRQSIDSPYAAVIPSFIQAMLGGRAPVIYGDGGQSRDFVHVQDVVQACELAINNEKKIKSAINIASGSATEINRLASILHQILPEAPPPSITAAREGEVYHSQASIEAARRALGYRPKIALQEGLETTVEWFHEFA